MEQIVLDIGSDVNVLTKKTWYLMGKPTMKWSPMKLRMDNQQNIIPLGILSRVIVELDGVRSIT